MRRVHFLQAFMWALWPPTLWAAPLIQQSFDGVPLVAWMLACVLSTMGGVCAFMLQLVALMKQSPPEPGKPPAPQPSTLIMLGTQMVCSWFAGSLFFLGCLHYQTPLYLNGIVVGVASFGGAKSIEWLWTKIFKTEAPK